MLPLIYFLIGFFTVPYLVPQKGYEQDFNVKPFEESSFFNRDGLMVHYREWNKDADKTIVLISGFGGSTYSWRHVIPDLASEGYRVIAMDPPPFGYSSKLPGLNHSVTYNAGLAWSLLNELNVESCVLTGHSMGGAIVAAMADTLPERVEYVVYVDGGAFTKAADVPLFRLDAMHRWAEIIGHYMLFREEVFNDITESAFGREPTEEEVEQILKPFLFRNSAASVADLAASGDDRTLTGAYKRIPSLVIWGTEDKWINENIGARFHRKLENSKLIMIEGAGHCPMETDTQEFKAHYLKFINGE